MARYCSDKNELVKSVFSVLGGSFAKPERTFSEQPRRRRRRAAVTGFADGEVQVLLGRSCWARGSTSRSCPASMIDLEPAELTHTFGRSNYSIILVLTN